MALQIREEKDEHNRIFIYGDNGAGKTHLAFTAPGRKLYIDYAGNPQVSKKFPNEHITIVDGPEKWDEMQKMWTDPLIEDHEVIIIDNTTQIYRLTIEQAIDIPFKGGYGARPADKIPILRDYNLASERLRMFVRNFVKMVGNHKHIILIGHPQVEKDEEIGGLVGGPALPGKVPAYLLSLFPEQIFMVTKQDKFVAQLCKKTYFPAATRVLDPTKAIENPNLATMYKWK